MGLQVVNVHEGRSDMCTFFHTAQGIVKRFFNEKEVTSTLVMDAIYSGCCAMEEQTRQWIFRETAKDTDLQKAVEPPPVHLDGSKGVFSLGENVLQVTFRLTGCCLGFSGTQSLT